MCRIVHTVYKNYIQVIMKKSTEKLQEFFTEARSEVEEEEIIQHTIYGIQQILENEGFSSSMVITTLLHAGMCGYYSEIQDLELARQNLIEMTKNCLEYEMSERRKEKKDYGSENQDFFNTFVKEPSKVLN